MFGRLHCFVAINLTCHETRQYDNNKQMTIQQQQNHIGFIALVAHTLKR